MEPTRTVRATARYLFVLGILQLIGLNLGGIFWLMWADGVRKGKRSSRIWVFVVHGLYLALAAVLLVWAWIDPAKLQELLVYGNKVRVPLAVGAMFLLLLIVVYAVPVVLLCRKDVAAYFRSQST